MTPRLLDLFCCQGGAGEGYRRAGFDITGVDIEPQPRNPHPFIQADALDYLAAHGHEYDAIHASPPCQAHTALRTLQGDKEYPELIEPTRALLVALGKPYVIENVEGAPLLNPVRVCGSGIGLPLLRRHRLFECSFPAMSVPCAHGAAAKQFPALNGDDRKRGGRSAIVGVYGNGGDKRADLWPEAMGIDWMDRYGLTQAIPPAYTEHIGGYLLAAVTATRLDVAA